MKKLILVLMIFGLSISLCYPANSWRKGTGEDVPLGSEDVSDLDDVIFQRITDPIDRLNSNYREGCEITFNTVSALTIGSGEVMLSNSGGSIRLMQQNTSTTPATFSDLDTGAETSSTTYYVYAVQNTATDSDFDIALSLNATSPTGFTYFKRLGSFFNNSSSNIEQIKNDNAKPEILVSTGTIANGATIPLPSGFTQEQCEWTVSVGTFTYGIGQGPSHPAIAATFTVNTSRVVTATTAGGTGTANYIIIGVKR